VESLAPERGDPPSTVLIRRSDWAEVARIPGSYDVHLQADGTVVASRSLTAGRRLVMAGPPNWAPRELEPLNAVDLPATLAGGRLLLLRSDVGGLLATVRTTDGHVVLQRSLGPLYAPAVGFDGRRLTWPKQPCATTSVMSWDIDTDPAPPRIARRCGAARINNGTARLRGRRVALRTACPERYAQGCRGRLLMLGSEPKPWASESVTLGRGRSAVRTVTLPGYARRAIRRHGRVRATVRFDARGGSRTRSSVLIEAGAPRRNL
jgi:hypothetical protein